MSLAGSCVVENKENTSIDQASMIQTSTPTRQSKTITLDA
jgi:hypothetical protein